MNKRDDIVKYFDDMCDMFYTEKIMYDVWEVFFVDFKKILGSDMDIDYFKYYDALRYCLVYCEDYGDERKYKDDMAYLKMLYASIKV